MGLENSRHSCPPPYPSGKPCKPKKCKKKSKIDVYWVIVALITLLYFFKMLIKPTSLDFIIFMLLLILLAKPFLSPK